VKIVAHRGFANDNIENTVQAFLNATDYCDYIELDIRESVNGIPIVFHDSNLKRLCGNDRKVSNLSVDEIQEYTIRNSNQVIPTFQDVLSKIESPLIVEIKDYDVVGETVKLCERANNTVIYQSFDPQIVKSIPDEYETVLLCTPIEYVSKEGIPSNAITSLQRGYKLVAQFNLNGLSLHYSMISEICSDMCMNDEFNHFAWTVRSHSVVENMNTQCLDGLITDSQKYVYK